MSVRFEISNTIKSKIEEHIHNNKKEIMLNSRLVGTRTVDNWKTYLTKDKINLQDVPVADNKNMINFKNIGVAQKMTSLVQSIFPDNTVFSTGHFHYPPTGFMSWHTNSNVPCKRLYLTWADEGNKSFFRYLEGEEVVTDYDDKGLTSRLFGVTGKEPFFWHCVGSETNRLSFGYAIQ